MCGSRNDLGQSSAAVYVVGKYVRQLDALSGLTTC